MTVEVIDERRVRMDDDILSMTAATTRACEVDRPVAPMPHWRAPDGRLLRDIYNETHSLPGTGQ